MNFKVLTLFQNSELLKLFVKLLLFSLCKFYYLKLAMF